MGISSTDDALENKLFAAIQYANADEAIALFQQSAVVSVDSEQRALHIDLNPLDFIDIYSHLFASQAVEIGVSVDVSDSLEVGQFQIGIHNMVNDSTTSMSGRITASYVDRTIANWNISFEGAAPELGAEQADAARQVRIGRVGVYRITKLH